MEQPVDDTHFLNLALDHACCLARTLVAQQEDLLRVDPVREEGAGKLARAARAAAEVERALRTAIARTSDPENQP